MTSSKQDIAIIGSGLAGLSLALSLKKHNISSTIYELRHASYAAGGEIGLSPNALRVLDHLKVYQPLRLRGFNSDNFQLMNRSGQTLGVMHQGSLFGYPALRLPRRYVREELLKEAERKGIEVRYEKRFIRAEEMKDGGGLKVYFEDGHVVDTEMVIGADGLRSSVRKFVDAECEPKYSGTMVLYGMVSRSLLDQRLSSEDQRLPNPTMLFGREGSFTVWPYDYEGEKVGYIANIELPERSKEEWRRFGENAEGLRDLLKEKFCGGGWPEQVQIMCQETSADEFKIWPINMVPPVSSWTSPSGKVIIIGDAAHAISPSGGQGGAMSFEDAESLAYAISKCGKDTGILQKWETHRKQRVNEVVAFNNLSARLRQASQYSLVQTIREWFIWGLLKVKGPQGYQWLYGFDAEVAMANL